jgi:hypothetical protein
MLQRSPERSSTMKRLVLTLAVAALALPATALAKGPSEATISGPGGGGSGGGDVTITGCCEPGSPAMNLAEQAGFFPAVFPQEPNRMSTSRPKGTLGPKYTITYTVPGPNNETWKIRQDVYPYATPAPVTYMKPGQTVFQIPGGTRGGWFQADARLKETLVAAGLPARPSGNSSNTTSLSTNVFSALAVALFLVAATAIFLRRRAKPAAA